jgi:hypothetical protein
MNRRPFVMVTRVVDPLLDTTRSWTWTDREAETDEDYAISVRRPMDDELTP